MTASKVQSSGINDLELVEQKMTQPVPGLRYVPDYLESATHDRVLDVVDVEPWLTSTDHRVQIYGYGYSHAKRAAHQVRDLPDWASELAQQLCRDGIVPAVPDQLVINDYPPGTGIFPHVDQAVFGQTVASLSLASSCVMQFTHAESAQVERLLLEPRSVLILSGEARWAWRHEIPARLIDEWEGQQRPRSRRVSLTFRIMPRSRA
jgi:alkylated DNA repair dioxygenase AlkB